MDFEQMDKEFYTNLANCEPLNIKTENGYIQYIIDGDEISVIEFAPRVGGGISYKNIKSNTGFDIISSTIDSYLQKPVNVRYQRSNRYFSVNLVYGIPSTFHHMTGIEDLLNGYVLVKYDDEVAQYYNSKKKKRADLNGPKSSKRSQRVSKRTTD